MEAKELECVRSLRSSKGKPAFMTTSCCPAYVNCIKKHIPELEDAISKTPTPMQITASLAREKFPGCIPVFIGPCVAKRQEALRNNAFALSFVELFAILHAKEVDVTKYKPLAGFEIGSKEGRAFAVSGGVSGGVLAFLTAAKPPAPAPSPATPTAATTAPPPTPAPLMPVPILINGLTPTTVKQLRSYTKKHPVGQLIEVMACEGGCVAGPATPATVPIATAKVKVEVGKTKHHPQASQTAITPFVPPAEETRTS
eukprot:TRINITY_DN487_c0_g1_i5.p1 TRINITY_DN487_c0_g1~~TRINITY_DN487_c0_g1_i5.p1  ORF type:complete len:256 (+),score=59.14 TRINITY_DN487_c0_g1_i5:75-842(+)